MRKRHDWMFYSLLLVGIAALLMFSSALLRGSRLEWQFISPPTTEDPALLEPIEPLPLEFRGRHQFYYNNLGDTEREAYDLIMERLPRFPRSIPIPVLDELQLNRVFHALMLDNPLLFHISDESSTLYQGRRMEFVPAYRMDEAAYRARCGELAEACARFASRLPEGAGQTDIELSLHDQLVRQCEYQYSGNYTESTVYGALVEGVAACEGYSKAMLLLLDLQGIDCYIVTGKAQNSAGKVANHAWNKVFVGAGWYHLDATWNDPVGEEAQEGYGLTHAYFNLNDEELGVTHELTDDGNPCVETAENYFVRGGLFFSELDRDAETVLAGKLAEAVDAGQEQLEFRMASAAAFEAAKNTLFEKPQQRVYRILSKANLASGTRISETRVAYSEAAQLNLLRMIPLVEK
ncbi:MAG: hypothetical protein FWH26_04730 [Oscillospiraceae bacterium]|nr:hypothetical protein [Oscillospiraceae bacterium]